MNHVPDTHKFRLAYLFYLVEGAHWKMSDAWREAFPELYTY
jgi:hypothetical protein